jgi:hypothetical protein
MNFSQPFFLFSLLSALLFLWIVLRRPRRRLREVSQVFLFLRARKEVLFRFTRWQLIKNLIIVLQLLFLIFLSLAVAGPQGVIPPWSGKYCVVVVDTSLSMMAQDIVPDRLSLALDLAQAKTEELLSSGNTVSLWELSSPPRIVQGFTTNSQKLKDALRALEPSYSSTDILGLLELLDKWAAPKKVEVYLFSDLAFSLFPERFPQLVLHSQAVGQVSDNLAIVSSKFQDPVLWLSLKNFSQKEREVHLLIDGQRLKEPASIWMESMGSEEVSLTLTSTKPYLKVEIEEKDALPWDNVIYVVRPQPLKVILVSSSPFLKSAFQAMNLMVVSVNPQDYSPDLQGDLVVFENFLPQSLPDTPLFVVHPPQGNGFFPWLGIEEEGFPVLKESPLLEFLDLSSVDFYQVPVIQSPTLVPVGYWGRAPFLLQGTIAGRKAVVFSPNLSYSNFTLEASFPVFLANVVRFLTGDEPGPVLPEQVRSEELLEPSYGGERFSGSPPGLYLHKGAQELRFYSCALMSEEESNLTRHTEVERLGASESTDAPRDLTPFFLAFPLTLILIEEILRKRHV